MVFLFLMVFWDILGVVHHNANKDVVDAFARLLSALEQNQSLHKPPWPSPSFPGHRLAQAGSTCQSQSASSLDF